MSYDSPLAAIDDFVKIVDDLQIPYFLGGSFASSLQGDYRATNDLDFLCQISVGSIDQLIKSLETGFIVDDLALKKAVNSRKSFNIFHESSFIKIDVFTDIGIYEKEQLRRAIAIEIPGCTELVKICSPEDIILAKMRWYVLGGQVSERQLADISGVIKTQKKLDRDYIHSWSLKLDLEQVCKLVFEGN